MNVSKEMASSAEAQDFTNPKAFLDMFKDLFHAVTILLTPLSHQNADVALQYCKVYVLMTYSCTCDELHDTHLGIGHY